MVIRVLVSVSFIQVIARIRFSGFPDYYKLDTKTGWEEIRWTFPDQKIERRMERGQVTKRTGRVTDNFDCFILPPKTLLLLIIFFYV